MVRAQGGTEAAVRLGLFSRDFYASQHERLGIDSGFVAQGYFMPCFSDREVAEAEARIAMQQGLGLDVRWVGPDELDDLNPAMARRPHPGRVLRARRRLHRPAAQRARLHRSAVHVRRPGGRAHRVHRAAACGAAGSPASPRPTATIATERVVLTGGPTLAAVGRAAGVRIPAGGARHQVVVTQAHPDLAADRLPMVFDLASGIYWRPEEGGVLWGMSNPDEQAGEATEFDWAYYDKVRARMSDAVAGHRRPRPAQGLGRHHRLHPRPPADPRAGHHRRRTRRRNRRRRRRRPRDDVGSRRLEGRRRPGRCSARTDVVDVTDLGLDRFDEHGRSPARPRPDRAAVPRRTPSAHRGSATGQRRIVDDEVVGVPIWLILVIVIGGFLLIMLGLAFLWSKWMTRPGAPED